MRYDPIGIGIDHHPTSPLGECFNDVRDLEGLIKSGKPLLVHFKDPKHPATPDMEQNLKDAAKNVLNGSVSIFEVDIDAQPELAQMKNSPLSPEVQIFSHGAMISELPGVHGVDAIIEAVHNAVDIGKRIAEAPHTEFKGHYIQ